MEENGKIVLTYQLWIYSDAGGHGFRSTSMERERERERERGKRHMALLVAIIPVIPHI